MNMRLEADSSRRKADMTARVRMVYESLREAMDEGSVPDWVMKAMDEPKMFLITRDLSGEYVGCRIEFDQAPYTYVDTIAREIASEDLGRVCMPLDWDLVRELDRVVMEQVD